MSSIMDSPTTSRSQTGTSLSDSLRASHLASTRISQSRPETLLKSYSDMSFPTTPCSADPATEIFQQKLRERKEELQRQGRLGDDSEQIDHEGLSSRYAAKNERRTASNSSAFRRTSGQTMGLREQEEHLSKLDKQNFDLKLRIYHQDKRLDELLVELERRDAEEKETTRLIEQQQRELEHRDQSLKQAVDTILFMDYQIRQFKQILQEHKDGIKLPEGLPELELPYGEKEKDSVLPKTLRGYAREVSADAISIDGASRKNGNHLNNTTEAEPFHRTSSALSRYTDDSHFAIDRLTMKSPVFSVLSEGDLESVYAWKEDLRRRPEQVDTRSEADLSDLGRVDGDNDELALQIDGRKRTLSSQAEKEPKSQILDHQLVHNAGAKLSYPDLGSESAILDSDVDSDLDSEPEIEDSVSATAALEQGTHECPSDCVRPNLERAQTALAPSEQSNSQRQFHALQRTMSSSSVGQIMPPRRPAQDHTPPRRPRPLPPLPAEMASPISYNTPASAPSAPSTRRAARLDHPPSPSPTMRRVNGAYLPSGTRRTHASDDSIVRYMALAHPQHGMGDSSVDGGQDTAHAQSRGATQLPMGVTRPVRRPPPTSRRPRPYSLSAKEEQLLKYIEGIDGEFYIRGPREMMLAAGMFNAAYATDMHLPPTPPDTVAAGSSAAGSRQNVALEIPKSAGNRAVVAREDGATLPVTQLRSAPAARVTFGPTHILNGPAGRPLSTAAAPNAAPSRRRISFLKGRRMSWALSVGRNAEAKTREKITAAVKKGNMQAKDSDKIDVAVSGEEKNKQLSEKLAEQHPRRGSESSDGGEKDAVAGLKRRRWSIKASTGGGKH